MAVDKPNIFLKNTEQSIPYTSSGGGEHNYPLRNDYYAHATRIQTELKTCIDRSTKQKQVAAIRYKEGIYLEFSGKGNCELATASLENRPQGIKLLNIKNDAKNSITSATVYVPQGKEIFYIEKIQKYSTEITASGNHRFNDLISSIENIKLAFLSSFWIGKEDDMPNKTAQWCEVWLRYEVSSKNESCKDETIQDMTENCTLLNIQIDKSQIEFPERVVVLIKANKSQLTDLIFCCKYIAEIRRAPEVTSFFGTLAGKEQKEWCDELLTRTTFTNSNATICLLDTGLNSEHSLIKPAILNRDTLQTVTKKWGANDHDGHGTEMAGVALYFDLKDSLTTHGTLEIKHKIESVKIVPPHGNNKPELYGDVTEQAVALAEITNPNSNRSLCMAVTAPQYNTENGYPTSWSAAIDTITSGANEENEKRLFFISAENTYPEEVKQQTYPSSCINHQIENPGQSWNAVTVGAYTKDIDIKDSYYQTFQPVANNGELSPYSSTSMHWENKQPVKPEIVLDGGNMAKNETDCTECEDLSLLTTSHKYLTHPFSTIWGTSSATAQAANMAAQIYAEYPDIWPETVRALLIHSANWTPAMCKQFCTDNLKTSGIRNLLRTCGYGIPNLNKAIKCANNSVNLVIQGTLQPYNTKKMNEMHLHELPWPHDVLQSLDNENVTLKVTLSYFIEPGPGEIGWKDKYRYPSCALRFDVINSNENEKDFLKRVNNKMRKDKDDTWDGSSRNWYLGTQNRDGGSIHSDWCNSTAIDLCDAKYIAVFPIIGWWRTRPHLKKNNNTIRYSLIVSLETPKVENDLYTPIITQIENKIPISIQIPHNL